MAGMSKSLKDLFHRRGHFDGYTLTGWLYQIDDGVETAWNFMSVSPSHETRNYWVSGEVFRGVTLHMFHPATGRNHIELHGILTDVSEAERSAIRTATKKWEQEYQDLLLADNI